MIEAFRIYKLICLLLENIIRSIKVFKNANIIIFRYTLYIFQRLIIRIGLEIGHQDIYQLFNDKFVNKNKV